MVWKFSNAHVCYQNRKSFYPFWLKYKERIKKLKKIFPCILRMTVICEKVHVCNGFLKKKSLKTGSALSTKALCLLPGIDIYGLKMMEFIYSI